MYDIKGMQTDVSRRKFCFSKGICSLLNNQNNWTFILHLGFACCAICVCQPLFYVTLSMLRDMVYSDHEWINSCVVTVPYWQIYNKHGLFDVVLSFHIVSRSSQCCISFISVAHIDWRPLLFIQPYWVLVLTRVELSSVSVVFDH